MIRSLLLSTLLIILFLSCTPDKTLIPEPMVINLADVEWGEPGAFIIIPGGVPHHWDVPESVDAIILVKRTGPARLSFRKSMTFISTSVKS